MSGERCPHCGAWVQPARRGGDQVRAFATHLDSCPGLLRVVKR